MNKAIIGVFASIFATLLVILTVFTNSSYVFFEDEPVISNDGFSFSETRSRATKSWTFMVYMAGDNSLGAVPQMDMVEADLKELESAGSDSNINIIVLVDKYGWRNSVCYYIEPGVRTEISLSLLGFSTSELNMGSADTLRKFVDYTLTTYPATYTFLDMWDHGTGWISFCSDNTNSDEMTATEFETAMRLIKAEHGRVDILGWDACYMANQEIMYQAKDYGDIYLASEHREAFDGWDYANSLSWLKSNPTATPTQFSTRIINDYDNYYSTQYTLSAVDLKSYDINITDNLNLLLQSLKHRGNNYNTEIRNARSSSYFYRYRTSSNTFCDLYDFVGNIHTSGITNATIKNYCVLIKAAINSSVIYQKHSTDLPDSHGLTFYFPDSPIYFDYQFLVTKWCIDSEHYDFLKAYWRSKDTVPDIPTTPTIEIYGTTCYVNGSGGQAKIDRGDWRTGSITISTGSHTIFGRRGNDYSVTNSTVISGCNLVITATRGTSFSVTFPKGWNIVCAPQDQTHTAKTLCIEMGAKEVIRRNPTTGIFDEYVYNYSPDSKDFIVDSTKGYYVYFTASRSYTYQNVAERPVSVATGWNLVGFATDNKASTVLGKSDSMKNIIYRTSSGAYDSYNAETQIGDFTINKGYGGFVYASNPVAVRI